MSFPESFSPSDFARVALSLEGLVTLGTTKSECLQPLSPRTCKCVIKSVYTKLYLYAEERRQV